MVLDMNYLQMEALIKEITFKIKWRDKASTTGQEGRFIKASFITI